MTVFLLHFSLLDIRFSKWRIRRVFKRCDRTEINTEEKQEKMTQKALNQQLKDLKDLLEETNGKIAALDKLITHNHNELMGKITIVEQTANQALQTATKNEERLFELESTQDQTKEDIKNELKTMKESIKEEINIRKIEGQLKAALIELEDLRNRSMRSTFIFKNIKEEKKEMWEDTARILTNFIVEDLKLSYRYDEIDNQISRAHRGSSEDSNDNQTNRQGHRAIYAQFVNWRTAEEIQNRVIELNSKKQTPVIVNQMFSKELTKRRNQALKKRKEILQNDNELQIKLEFPAKLMSRNKHTKGKWEILQTF